MNNMQKKYLDRERDQIKVRLSSEGARNVRDSDNRIHSSISPLSLTVKLKIKYLARGRNSKGNYYHYFHSVDPGPGYGFVAILLEASQGQKGSK